MTRAVLAAAADAPRLDLRLPPELAAELLEGTEGPFDAGADAPWDAEISRRVTAIDAGTQNLEPWEKVRRRMERKIRNR